MQSSACQRCLPDRGRGRRHLHRSSNVQPPHATEHSSNNSNIGTTLPPPDDTENATQNPAPHRCSLLGLKTPQSTRLPPQFSLVIPHRMWTVDLYDRMHPSGTRVPKTRGSAPPTKAHEEMTGDAPGVDTFRSELREEFWKHYMHTYDTSCARSGVRTANRAGDRSPRGQRSARNFSGEWGLDSRVHTIAHRSLGASSQRGVSLLGGVRIREMVRCDPHTTYHILHSPPPFFFLDVRVYCDKIPHSYPPPPPPPPPRLSIAKLPKPQCLSDFLLLLNFRYR